MKISRALLLAGAVALLTSALASAATPAASKQLNVLFLIADDLNCDLGSYGDTTARTPHLDRLAARGVRFDRAYCQYPLCSPSRASLLTGRRPNVTGVTANPSAGKPLSPHFREKIPETITLPQLFKRHGWFSARVGKLYHYGVPNDIGTSSLDDHASWDQVINPRGRDRESHDRIFSLEPGTFGATLSWLADGGKDDEQTDGIGASEGIALLERFKKTAKPFFLAVGFYRPHTPYVAPQKYFDLHPTDQIKLPELSADDKARTPAAGYASFKKEQDTMTDAQRRQAIQAYHASISFLDAQVGRVVAALDRLGLADSTVIVFTSDHGYHMGDHGLWQKRSLFENSARVPLIIAAPGARANGKVAHGVVELLDLYPTLTALCGLKAPDYLAGVSLVPTLADANHRVKPAALTQTGTGAANAPRGWAVRTERWRYIEWIGGTAGRQLFDMEHDPRETTNLAADPKHAGTVKELSALLQGHGGG